METIIRPIAHIKSDFTDKFGIPRQSGLVPELTARIVFEPEYRDPNALVGLEGYSHLWLIWQFSTVAAEYAAGKSWRPTVRPPRLGGNENAQKYFRDYKKKQTAGQMLKKLLLEGEDEIEYLANVLYEVETAPGEQALNEVRAELKSQGYLKYYKQRERKQKPADFLRYRSSDGFEILIGRNNLQNDKLTLHTARGKDVWFHVQKAPGSHTVVMSRGEDVPDTTKQEAAELAVLHSSQNGGAKVPVDTTEVRNIWKANGARPGMVLYNDYTTVYITPRAGLEEKLREK